MKLKIAARGSKLSLKQVEMFINYVKKYYPHIEYEIITVKTSGDRFSSSFEELAKKGLVGLFEKEVNKEVLEGRANVAVHSLKDLPSSMHPDLEVVAYLPRDPPYDVLVSRRDMGLFDLPPGAVVGTSSARRRALIKNIRPDLIVKDLRGNVDTRLRKLKSGEYDAIVLAEAGLKRLEMEVEYERLDWRLFPPSPGQGIVVAVARKGTDVADALKAISDERSERLATAERNVLKEYGGGCFVALGAIAFDDPLRLRATALTPDGSKRVDVEVIGGDPAELGKEAARLLKASLPVRSTVGTER
ncbi:MAG: hydroxymethylbilane synthase [Crenarchaeota archaeon]|nr:hydroxymethylbilane synthase [Thermoproteota archaeon]